MNKEYYQTKYLELAQQIPNDERDLIADLSELFETDPQEAYEGLLLYLDGPRQLKVALRGPLTLQDTIDRIDEKLEHLIHGSIKDYMILDPHLLAEEFSRLKRELEEGYQGDQEEQIYRLYDQIMDMIEDF